jgi:predicted DCC family thiol-disulfide oxidoreductase YuxK
MSPSDATHDADIRILFDGDCPLCKREISMLERMDQRRQKSGETGRRRIDFEDISAQGFDAGRYGLENRAVHERIHGVLGDGTVVEGVEVFRVAYSAVGFGWLVAPTRWPLIEPIANLLYRLFARNRLRFTGRRLECESGSCRAVPRKS